MNFNVITLNEIILKKKIILNPKENMGQDGSVSECGSNRTTAMEMSSLSANIQVVMAAMVLQDFSTGGN